jgi:uncharacterized integral membrane protein
VTRTEERDVDPPQDLAIPVAPAVETDSHDDNATAQISTRPDESRLPPFTHTRASGFWAAIVVGLLILLVLLIFVLENGQQAKVAFLGFHAHLPEGAALLLAAVIGGLGVVASGAARILQLRSRARATPGGGRKRRRRR